MINKLVGNWVVRMFCILWATFLYLDYFNASGYFIKAFQHFVYTDLLITVFVLTIGVAWLFSKNKPKGSLLEIKNFRGIYHYVFVIILMGLVMAFYLTKSKIIPNTGTGTILFLLKTIVFHLGFGVIVLAALSTGLFLLSRLPIHLESSSLALIATALGFFIITMGLFVLGAAGVLYQFVVIPFILILILPGWKQSLGILNQALFKKSDNFQVHIAAVLSYVFMLFLIAITLNFDSRIFPVGFDGLNLYMNTPKLIAGYNGLTEGGDAYNWALMMSLGMIMYKSTLISILISVVPGILCLIAIYKISTALKINRNWSIFACALFYSLPNTIWQSKNDEKTDLAFLFITLCSVLLFISFQSAGTHNKIKETGKKLSGLSPMIVLWSLAGCLVGYSFGIKYVAMMSAFAFLVVIFYTYSGKFGAISIFFLIFALIFVLDLTSFAAFERDFFVFRFLIPAIIGLIVFIYAFIKNKAGLTTALKMAFVFCIAIGITFMPWAIKNLSENKKFSINHILTGKSPLPDLYPQSDKISSYNATTTTKQNHLTYTGEPEKVQAAGFGMLATNENSGSNNQKTESESSKNNTRPNVSTEKNSPNSEKVEEIRRYLGYESGIIRFISLPYDIAMKANVKLGSSDSGIFLLILIPIFVFALGMKNLHWNILKIILLLFFLIVSVLSVQLNNGTLDINSVLSSLNANGFGNTGFSGFFLLPLYVFMKQQLLLIGAALLPIYHYLTIQSLGVCFVIIVLSTIPLYFFLRSSIAGLDTLSKTLIAFVYCVIQFWLVLSSGIIWYGIAGFSLIPLVIAILANKKESELNSNSEFIKKYIGVCTGIWFLLILPFQLVPIRFIYESDPGKINFSEFMDPPFVKYVTGSQSEQQVFKQFFSPAEQNIINTLNRDKKANIINISTFLKYHIVNNDTRVYMDNQLGIFRDIANNVSNDKKQIVGELRKKKIKYMLVGLNTARVDKTPDKSLTKKFENLMQTLVNNPEVKLLYTNRLVSRPDGDMRTVINGVQVITKYDVAGERVIEPGSVALFEIL